MDPRRSKRVCSLLDSISPALPCELANVITLACRVRYPLRFLYYSALKSRRHVACKLITNQHDGLISLHEPLNLICYKLAEVYVIHPFNFDRPVNKPNISKIPGFCLELSKRCISSFNPSIQSNVEQINNAK